MIRREYQNLRNRDWSFWHFFILLIGSGISGELVVNVDEEIMPELVKKNKGSPLDVEL